MITLLKPQLITVKIDYYIPDYKYLINEFIWQTEDQWPEIPRIHRFLLFWKDNIDATINKVFVTKSVNNWRNVTHEF